MTKNNNKNKTIINNKNIIQICGNIKKQHKQSSSSSSSSSRYPSTTNVSVIPNSSTPIYNSFPNSTSLEDESRKIRFLQAMRDPVSTKSPYSIFDNGSNTFQREGNTAGYEEPASAQINPDEYFDEPQRPQPQFSQPRFAQPQFRTESQSTFTIPRTASRQVRIQASPSEFLETPNRNFSPIPLATTTRFSDTFRQPEGEDGFDEEETDRHVNIGELGGFEQPDVTTKTIGGYHESPFVGLTQEDIERDIEMKKEEKENEKMGLEDINRDDYQAKEERSQLLETKNREKREKEAFQAFEEEKRNRKLKREQQAARAILAAELARQKVIRMKFVDVTQKLKALISTGEKKVEKDSKLKGQIKELLKDKSFTEYVGDRNIRSLSDAKKILEFLNTGSEKVLQKIQEIEETNKDSRIPPGGGGKATIHTIEEIKSPKKGRSHSKALSGGGFTTK